MKVKQPDYLSYLLRLWREKNVGQRHRCEKQDVWRASLEDSLSRKRHGFQNLDDLFAFLQQETGVVKDGVETVDDGQE
jgi:hypothetical protein